jgi:hypothetical protein
MFEIVNKPCIIEGKQRFLCGDDVIITFKDGAMIRGGITDFSEDDGTIEIENENFVGYISVKLNRIEEIEG